MISINQNTTAKATSIPSQTTMATKRKKNDEWLKNNSDTNATTPTSSLSSSSLSSSSLSSSSNQHQQIPKYLELKQRIELLEEEKDKNLKKLKQLEQKITEADNKCVNHLKQLTELNGLVTDLEIKLEKKSQQYNQAIKQLTEDKQFYLEQEEKWQIFEKDLLTAVRVANEFKTEAEVQSDLLLNENKTLTEKIRNLENELNKLKVIKSNDNEINFRKKRTEEGPHLLIDDVLDSNSNKQQLIRQQSADSVFSTSSSSISKQQSNRSCVLLQTNSSQSLILNNHHNQLPFNLNKNSNSNKSQVSVKSLVETIENASKTTSNGSIINLISNHNQQISKSPSFSSINLAQQQTSTTENVALNLKQLKKDDDKLIRNHSQSKLLNNNKKENYCPINNGCEKDAALNNLIKDAGSKRNGLLKWCKNKVKNYEGIEISNFSSDWKDSMVICALLHSLDHTLIPFHSLDRNNKKNNFQLAFNAARKLGIQCNLNIEDLINEERPDWSKIMAYVASIYNHFENNNKNL